MCELVRRRAVLGSSTMLMSIELTEYHTSILVSQRTCLRPQSEHMEPTVRTASPSSRNVLHEQPALPSGLAGDIWSKCWDNSEHPLFFSSDDSVEKPFTVSGFPAVSGKQYSNALAGVWGRWVPNCLLMNSSSYKCWTTVLWEWPSWADKQGLLVPALSSTAWQVKCHRLFFCVVACLFVCWFACLLLSSKKK